MDNTDNNNSGDNFPPSFPNDNSFQDFEFDSYSDFNDIGDQFTTSIDVDQYAFQELDLDVAKYRSIQTVQPTIYSLNSMAPPQFGSCSSSLHVKSDGLFTKAPAAIAVKPTSRPVVVPEQPFHIAVTHFCCAYNIDTLISMIENDLNSIFEISYKFCLKECRWDCVYLCGSTRCKFELNVYRNGSDSFIVEGNRLCGDTFPFSTIFKSVRANFVDEPSPPMSALNFQFIPLPESAVELSSEETSEAIAHIIAMARSGKCESQAIAAQFFCDLSLQQNMTEILSQKDCVNTLISLSRVEFDFCNQHAICALANLSSSRYCQDILLQDELFLQELLQLCSNGTYETAEMRRECARLLANLCTAKASAKHLLQVVGEVHVGCWLDSINDLQDSRLRLHAERAMHSLNSCLV